MFDPKRITILLLAAAALGLFAQGGRSRSGRGFDPSRRMAPPMAADARWGVPDWEIEPVFRKDAFTFVRLRYESWGRGGWRTDFPAADLNLSFRLQQLTSMRVEPDPMSMDIEDAQLFDYPFLFMIDPRAIDLSKREAMVLRRYLLNGGFLLVDDFWGDRMWEHLMGEMRKVFPEREPISLPLSHPIFHTPFPVKVKPQVPSEDSAHRTQNMPDPYRTWEDEISWEEPQPADYRAFVDDKGRIMVLICWNTDLSDGWEEEGVSDWFFRNFSEKFSYPMAVNILFHALSH